MKLNAFDQTISRILNDLFTVGCLIGDWWRGRARSYALLRYANLQERRRTPLPYEPGVAGKSSWKQCSLHTTPWPMHSWKQVSSLLYILLYEDPSLVEWRYPLPNQCPLSGFELFMPSWKSQAPTLQPLKSLPRHLASGIQLLKSSAQAINAMGAGASSPLKTASDDDVKMAMNSLPKAMGNHVGCTWTWDFPYDIEQVRCFPPKKSYGHWICQEESAKLVQALHILGGRPRGASWAKNPRSGPKEGGKLRIESGQL